MFFKLKVITDSDGFNFLVMLKTLKTIELMKSILKLFFDIDTVKTTDIILRKNISLLLVKPAGQLSLLEYICICIHLSVYAVFLCPVFD